MADTYNQVTAQQTELSFAPPQNFFLAVERLPRLQFTVQQVNVPPISGGEAAIPTRFNSGRAFMPGDTVDYAQLDVTFLIDNLPPSPQLLQRSRRQTHVAASKSISHRL